uniref:HAD family hydrolase n=1 Tax=Paraburkholderia sp. 22B1P TaxID=3080498 RepID=UPI00403F902B
MQTTPAFFRSILPSRAPKALLFDFDQTLVNSAEAIVHCARSAISDMGLPTPERELIRRSIGLSLEATFHFITGIADTGAAKNYAAHFVKHADRVMVHMTTFVDRRIKLTHWGCGRKLGLPGGGPCTRTKTVFERFGCT